MNRTFSIVIACACAGAIPAYGAEDKGVVVAAADGLDLVKPPPPSADNKQPAPSPAPSNLDFDLLGTATPPPAPDPVAMRVRRTMLSWHQGLGIGLVALMAGTMVTGQLNYDDRFLGSSSGRYQNLHTAFVFSTMTTFAATGLLALLAPSPIENEHRGLDRVRLHEIGMIGATVGMVAEATLGMLTVHNEGRISQANLARTHLIVGYVTYAFMAEGVGALIF